jgi:hypothetical protein
MITALIAILLTKVAKTDEYPGFTVWLCMALDVAIIYKIFTL